MYAQIVIDCQTKKETVSCGDCILKEGCHLRLEFEEKNEAVESDVSLLDLLVPILLVRV